MQVKNTPREATTYELLEALNGACRIVVVGPSCRAARAFVDQFKPRFPNAHMRPHSWGSDIHMLMGHQVPCLIISTTTEVSDEIADFAIANNWLIAYQGL